MKTRTKRELRWLGRSGNQARELLVIKGYLFYLQQKMCDSVLRAEKWTVCKA